MKGLFKYIKGYRTEAVLGPLLKLFEASLELIVPLIIAKIVDYGILQSNSSYAVKMALVLVLIGVVGLLFSVTAQYFSAKAAVGFSSKLRRAIFSKVQTMSYTDLDEIGVSTLITRMSTDTSKVQNGLNLALRLLLRSPFIVFGAMIMAFTVDAKSAGVFAATIPLLAIVVFGILLISMPLYKKVQRGTDSVTEKTRENLSGVRVIRAFSMEKSEIEEFKRRNNVLADAEKRVGKFSALLNPLTYVIINLAILYLVYVGAIRVDAGDITQGEVLALYNYMSQILVELVKLANLIISITRALASASRISDVLSIETTDISGKAEVGSASPYSVEFSNVCMRYSGSSEDSVRNLTLKVKKGETIGIIGGTGSGKTTLVNLIPGFYLPRCGTVSIDGLPVSEYAPEALREIVGVVPQKAVLFRGTVRENLLWGKPDATDEQLYEALRAAHALGVVNNKGGLDAIVEEGGQNFSGGQRQRLTIARALVKKPEILILDDSASALDYATDAALRASLRELDGNITTFIVSQRASSIMHADTIVVLEDGDVVGIGTHDELISSSPVYKEIYNSQFESKGGEDNGR